jgi:PKD repeat protein
MPPFVIDVTVIDDDTGSSPTLPVTVTVNNVAPTLSNVSATSILENGVSTLSAVINEVSPLDTFSLIVNWGDGSVMTYSYGAGTTAVTETHQFLDDDPTATAADPYTLTLTLVDDNGGTAIAATGITVTNVAPTAGVQANPAVVLIGAPVDFTGVVSDVGTLDTHTFVWDFGDGVTTTGSLTPTHTYSMAGVYDVVLTVTDDDTGVSTAAVQVTVGMPTDVILSSFEGQADGVVSKTAVISLLFLLGLAGFTLQRKRSD